MTSHPTPPSTPRRDRRESSAFTSDRYSDVSITDVSVVSIDVSSMIDVSIGRTTAVRNTPLFIARFIRPRVSVSETLVADASRSDPKTSESASVRRPHVPFRTLDTLAVARLRTTNVPVSTDDRRKESAATECPETRVIGDQTTHVHVYWSTSVLNPAILTAPGPYMAIRYAARRRRSSSLKK